MKNVHNYILEAGRGRPRKTEPDETPELKDVKGKSPEKNNSGGSWAVDWAPDNPQPITKEELNANVSEILGRIKRKHPFFVQGRAGWGKTSVILDIAKRCHRHVVTCYLDKILPEELAGYPIPEKGKNGRARVNRALPEWADVIAENDDKDFLLFFDEMNQATPDVMSALMPIVLEKTVAGVKLDNIVIGAAGNFKEENKGGVSDIPEPLEQRFGGIIEWETRTPATWKSAMNFLRKKYKDSVADSIIDAIDDIHDCFDSPRLIDHHLLDGLVEVKDNGDGQYFEPSYWEKEIKRLCTKTRDLERSEKAQISQLAEMIWKFTNNKLDKKVGRSSKGKDINMIPEKFIKNLKSALERGYMPQDDKKYGISRENVANYIDDTECNGEMLDSLLDKFEADGVKIRFQKDQEWKDAGYEDPETANEY